MSTTFEWNIANLERETADGFVFVVHYTVSASNDAYSASAYGSVGLERPETLIAYDSLTEEQVIGWVKAAIGGDEKVTEIQDALQSQLDEKAAPTKSGGVPWAVAAAD